jgi:hypothetical protein
MAATLIPVMVSEELLQAIRTAAQADGLTPPEWIAEAAQKAVRRRDLRQRWEALTAFGQEHARAHGFREEDVDRLIHEDRAEREREG